MKYLQDPLHSVQGPRAQQPTMTGLMLGTDSCGGPFLSEFWENHSVPPVCYGGLFQSEVLGPIGFFVDFENYEGRFKFN